ncbi:hypothetical protein B0T20DRAFT_121835 [Sordaria brevicollis]|uniref:Uncharacterized protein n=1 Tax=Sordaria brevicollis TaxID=83679 RepID=A0AAE0PKV6_SORBR|nr:hypothetical protein B0T20DRAFT_121835 [Sordaria brevicollis]
MSSNSKEAQNDGSGHLHAKLVDEAESIMRQFSVPTCSTSLIDKILDKQIGSESGPREWKMYHQLTDVQRLQLESLFNCVRGFDDQACYALRGGRTAHVRSDILRSILVSLASLMFLRMSATITMATHGHYNEGLYPREAYDAYKRKERKFPPARLPFDGAKLVNDEGLASLKTDCELILKLINQLTAPTGKKASQ